MSFEAAFTAHLKSSVLLKSLAGEAVFYDEAPQGQRPPYIVWIDVSEVPYWHLGGECNLTERSVQVNCYDFRAVVANEMAEAVRMLMSGVYRVLGHGANTVLIRACMCRNARISAKVPATDGSARMMRLRGVELQIGLDQPVPVLV